MSPNPTALRSCVKEEDVDRHRSVRCSEYDECLDAALRNSWRSWSCARCTRFVPRAQHAWGAQAAQAPALARPSL
jgi:hypothetical protein